MRFSFTIMLRIGRNLSDGKVSKDNESGLNKCIVPAYFLIFMPGFFAIAAGKYRNFKKETADITAEASL